MTIRERVLSVLSHWRFAFVLFHSSCALQISCLWLPSPTGVAFVVERRTSSDQVTGVEAWVRRNNPTVWMMATGDHYLFFSVSSQQDCCQESSFEVLRFPLFFFGWPSVLHPPECLLYPLVLIGLLLFVKLRHPCLHFHHIFSLVLLDIAKEFCAYFPQQIIFSTLLWCLTCLCCIAYVAFSMLHYLCCITYVALLMLHY